MLFQFFTGLLIANIFLGKGYYICTVKNSNAGRIEAVQQYTGLFQSEAFVTQFISETYTSCYLPNASIKEFISIVHSFLRINPKNRSTASDGLKHPFLIKDLNIGVKRKYLSQAPKEETTPTTQERVKEDVLKTAGDSEVCWVLQFCINM